MVLFICDQFLMLIYGLLSLGLVYLVARHNGEVIPYWGMFLAYLAGVAATPINDRKG